MEQFDQDHGETAEAVQAKVKWFNPGKGFGFVEAENAHGQDAFLHITVLQDAGITEIGEDSLILCRIGQGQKGQQVSEVLELIDAGPNARSVTGGGGGGFAGGGGGGRSFAPPVVTGPVETVEGTVKWFKHDKGFGFVVPDDGGKDVFVHQSCLRNEGLHGLEPDQRVSMSVQTTAKGREATEVKVVG